MKEDFVRVGFVTGPLHAEIIKNLLASLEIDCILLREGASSVYGIVSGPLADIEVMAPRSRLEEARALLEEFNRGKYRVEPAPEEAEIDSEAEEYGEEEEASAEDETPAP